MISHAELVAEAEARGMPLTSLEKAKEGLAKAKKNGADVSMARLMLRFGRLTEEARDYIVQEYVYVKDGQ